MKQVLAGGDKRKSGVSSCPFMAADLDGVARWRLGARCAEMDSRRMVALSGVVVASTAARPGKLDATIQH